jgi:hypothetical protein
MCCLSGITCPKNCKSYALDPSLRIYANMSTVGELLFLRQSAYTTGGQVSCPVKGVGRFGSPDVMRSEVSDVNSCSSDFFACLFWHSNGV